MAEAGNNLVQVLTNPFSSSDQKTAFLKYQQQAALASALQQQGLSPLDTRDRMMGQIAYKVSPFEGLAKIADALVGTYGQKKAVEDLTNSYNPPAQDTPAPTPAPQQAGSTGDLMPDVPAPQDLPSPDAGGFSPSNLQALAAKLGGQQQPAQPQAGALANMPPDARALVQYYSSIPGGERAAAEIYTKFAGPTEQQKNFGTAMPAYVRNETMSPGDKAAQQALGTTYAGSLPYGTPPGGNAPPIPAAQAAQPPMQPGSVQNAAQQVAASALQPPAGPVSRGAAPMPPLAPGEPDSRGIVLPAETPAGAPPVAAGDVPPNPAGMSADQYKVALAAYQKGQEAKASALGTAGGESQLGLAQINSRIANAKKTIGEMLAVAPGTSTGVPLISDEQQNDFLQRFDHPTAKANSVLEQKSNQLYLQELAPLIKQLGSRGNQFVENAVKRGSAVDIRDNPETKAAVLKGLYEYLDNLQQNSSNENAILSGQSPNQPMPGTPVPDTSGWTIKRKN